MTEQTMTAEGGLTRREMLKRSALVGAVAWTTPIVGSFNTPAFAQVTSPPCECSAPNNACVQTNCGTNCGCIPTVQGECFCHQGTDCDVMQACTVQTDCDNLPGWKCAHSCCDVVHGFGTLCHPPCGTFAGAGDNTKRSTPF